MHTKIAMTFALATAMTALAAGAVQAAASKSPIEGGALSQHAVPSTLMAREAGEAPRGRDNERPGDRQRGRNKIDLDDQIAREANEPPRGQDNNRNRRNRGKG